MLLPSGKSGAHEPPKAAKERQTQHVRPSRISSPSHVPKFYLIRHKRPLHKSVKNKLLTFVRYRKGLPYKL